MTNVKTWRGATLLLAALTLAGCGLEHQILGGGDDQNAALGQTAARPTVFGIAVADEPQAALAAQTILNNGGNAADAAAAAGFVLSVTLPSRASLGGGGACLIKMPGQPATALEFSAPAPASPGGARPAAVPTLARGLLALQARYGQLPFPQTIVPAERLASASAVSPAFEADLQIVGPAILADPAAESVFGPTGKILPALSELSQPDLATTLEILRAQGVNGFYSGAFATTFLAGAKQAGALLTSSDLARTVPRFTAPAVDGGTVSLPTPPKTSPSPATASFAVLDRNGGAVACATSLNNLFGTGRIAPGTGILLAASPAAHPAPILAATMSIVGDNVSAITTGTGAGAISRRNSITCPGGQASCTATADPNGQGLAVGNR